LNSAIKYLREILFILGDDRKKLPWIIFLFFLSSLFDLAGLGIIGPYVSLIINPENMDQGNIYLFLQEIGFSMGINGLIITMSLTLLLVFLLKTIFVIIIKRVIIHFSFNQQMELQTYLMKAYQQLPYTMYLARNSADYVQTINGVVGRFTGGVLKTLLIILSEGIVGIVLLCFLAWTNVKALTILIVLLGSTMFITIVFSGAILIYMEKNIIQVPSK